MRHSPKDLANLLGSRLCHDLISPIGAVCNGVELLGMGPTGAMPELALISESVESANYKIQFYRVAFGISSDKQYVAPSEVRRVLAGMYKGSRLRVEWAVETDSPRPMVKLAFLLLMCAEAALPYGGTVRISETEDGWLLCAEGVTKQLDDGLWDTLRQTDIGVILTPAQVHFGLAPFAAEDAGRTIDPSHDETGITIRF